MDITEAWKKLERQKLEKPIEGNLQAVKQSQHPVEKLKRNYLIKTMMMIVFLIGFVILYFYFDQWMIRGVLSIVVAAYVVFLISSLSMYRSIRTQLPVDGSLINMLTDTKERISRALKFETISSLLIYPFAGTAGYLAGYTVSGADITRIFDNAEQVLIFVVVLIVFMIIGYFLGRKLTQKGYGKSLDEINRLISVLREE